MRYPYCLRRKSLEDAEFDRHIAPAFSDAERLSRELEGYLSRAGWSDEAAGAARLLAMEHVSNIVRHGQVPSGSTIQARLALEDEVARLEITDSGRAWDPVRQWARMAELPTDSEGGRGLTIIRRIAVHAEYFRRDNENTAFFVLSKDFTMEKRDD